MGENAWYIEVVDAAVRAVIWCSEPERSLPSHWLDPAASVLGGEYGIIPTE